MADKIVGIAGAGTMGNGIAHVFAQNGWEVYLLDMSEESLQRGLGTISKNMDRQIKKGALTEEDKAAALGRIHPIQKVDDFKGVTLVIEAIVENLTAKTAFFQECDEKLPPEVVFASNTSSISITKIAAATGRADRFIGMHFMNPVPMMKLVEVIRGHATNDATTKWIMDLSRELGKEPVEVNDYPGFISNRVLMPMINEAIFALYEGVADREAIDTVMKLGMNHPMGPLTLADFIGLDVCLFIMRVLQDGFGDPKYRPCPLLVKMVDAGYLGRKSGRGFYEYDK